jgi:hypothetical protein
MLHHPSEEMKDRWVGMVSRFAYNAAENHGEPWSLIEQQLCFLPERQMAKKRPEEIDHLVCHSALQEPYHLHTRFAYNAAETKNVLWSEEVHD